MAHKIKLKNVRISFANLFKPRAASKTDPNAKLKYSTGIIIPKSHPQVEELNEMIDLAGREKHGDKWAKMRKKTDPLHDGDAERDTDPAYADSLYLTASSERQPQIVDRKVQPILSDTEIWSGCYVNVTFSIYGFEVDVNKGVAFGLNNIQLLREGERLGGASNAEEDFEEVEDDEEFEMN